MEYHLHSRHLTETGDKLRVYVYHHNEKRLNHKFIQTSHSESGTGTRPEQEPIYDRLLITRPKSPEVRIRRINVYEDFRRLLY